MSARSLRLGRDNAIGLAVASISDPFFAEVVATIEMVARTRGFFVIVACTGEEGGEEETVITGLLARQVAGMILVPTASDQRYLVSQRPGIPLVCIDRPAVGIACDTVIVDNEAAGFTATSWLIAHGHRRIAFVGGPADKYTIKLRRSGYERALVEAGIEPDRAIAGDSAILPSEAGDVVRRLLRLAEPVTAVLTSNAKASIGVVHALHQVARTDVAMVGFDDFPMADTFSPPVTVVNQNPEFIGHQAIELLFRRLGGDHDLTPSQVMIPIELIARGSGEIPPPAKTAGQAPLSAATS